MKYPKSVIEMQKELGDPYEIKNIDCEPCLYRMHVSGIPCDTNAIDTVTEMLYAYSNKLLAEGRCIDDRIKIDPDRIEYEELIARGKF